MRKTWAALIAAALTAAPLAAVPLTATPAAALDNGLALTPPMGWNDWNAFGCDVSEQLVEQTADKIASNGLQAAGYRQVNIDDCWMTKTRDADGRLVPDPAKFPHGITGVAAYLHAKGLKLGIYESAGTLTCAGYPGSLGHEQQDANSFAAWGVDYLKYDNCYNQGVPAKQRYQAMGDALARTGRPIVYSLCDWGEEDVTGWGASVGNLWRTTGDIDASYGRMLYIFQQNLKAASVARPGAWNDPDMLEVGNGMTPTEDRTEFSLWAEMAAPLIAGTDLRSASADTLAVYGNREVIAVDQDRLGKQGTPVSMAGGLDVLAKPLADGSVAVTLFNENSAPAVISTTASAIGLHTAKAYTLRDLWAHTTTESAGTISATVPGHGTVMYRVAPTSRPGQHAPSVVLNTVVPSWSAGTSGTVTSTFTNNGVQAARDVRLAVEAPAGWTVTPLTGTRFAQVPSGHQAIAAFRVTAPAALPAPITRVTVTGTASVHGPGGAQAVTAPDPVELSTPVKAPLRTFSDTTAAFGAQDGRLAIDGAGADLWYDTDQYSAIYQPGAEHDGSTTVVKLTAQAATSEWAKAGIMVRNDITKPGSSPGYLILAEAPGKGYVLQWDSTGSGRLDSNSAPSNQGSGTAVYPSWLKLVRSGSAYTGYFSTDGTTWTQVGTATLPGVTATQDVGVFTTSHSEGTSGEADFTALTQS
ncbi:NEW3 domain-containing protein [Kitasatospora sp. GP82]|uniref:NEW3 domain-containing protein n=1 Tax=Kitasatospora sp. GP82 TaxID=3035089 RepID=UPI0024746717|nr:NEW3 domain-containing protein [Kitasatospora sp. GP82]MDH6128079.1 alpha-galactosidase [Kitasatospora sp. GP82]